MGLKPLSPSLFLDYLDSISWTPLSLLVVYGTTLKTSNTRLSMIVLYGEVVFTTRYLTLMVLAFSPTLKVVLMDMYHQTYVFLLDKSTNEPLKGFKCFGYI